MQSGHVVALVGVEVDRAVLSQRVEVDRVAELGRQFVEWRVVHDDRQCDVDGAEEVPLLLILAPAGCDGFLNSYVFVERKEERARRSS